MSSPLPLAVVDAGDGRVRVETVLRMVDGSERDTSFTLLRDNAAWLATEIRRYLTDPAYHRHEEERHGEVIVLRPGGTDPEPQLGLLGRDAEDGASHGSIWLDHDAAERLADALADLG
ncbi:MAG: hypothetical protein H6745_21400 [Deltaproteobacteria bacterium]|nr:hypothetical protein [Deltaproteobacteria bacterium]